jgi:hypothetical protein
MLASTATSFLCISDMKAGSPATDGFRMQMRNHFSVALAMAAGACSRWHSVPPRHSHVQCICRKHTEGLSQAGFHRKRSCFAKASGVEADTVDRQFASLLQTLPAKRPYLKMDAQDFDQEIVRGAVPMLAAIRRSPVRRLRRAAPSGHAPFITTC